MKTGGTFQAVPYFLLHVGVNNCKAQNMSHPYWDFMNSTRFQKRNCIKKNTLSFVSCKSRLRSFHLCQSSSTSTSHYKAQVHFVWGAKEKCLFHRGQKKKSWITKNPQTSGFWVQYAFSPTSCDSAVVFGTYQLQLLLVELVTMTCGGAQVCCALNFFFYQQTFDDL